MYLVAIGWLYVVLMMAVAEALSSQGSVLGAIITFVFYGLLPTGLLMYIMATPMRKRRRAALAAAEAQTAAQAASVEVREPDGRSHASSEPTAGAVRKEL
jgi:mannose/fructose/N-acetylgalactosamine-specific phosphotransferase system component IID